MRSLRLRIQCLLLNVYCLTSCLIKARCLANTGTLFGRSGCHDFYSTKRERSFASYAIYFLDTTHQRASRAVSCQHNMATADHVPTGGPFANTIQAKIYRYVTALVTVGGLLCFTWQAGRSVYTGCNYLANAPCSRLTGNNTTS